MSEPRLWTEDADGNWSAECGNLLALEGTPAENQMRFCCYCGGELREERYVEPVVEDEEDET